MKSRGQGGKHMTRDVGGSRGSSGNDSTFAVVSCGVNIGS